MLTRISHIGIAVEKIPEAMDLFERAFGLEPADAEGFGDLLFSMIPLGETNLELLQAREQKGQIARFIEKRGPGLHHVALETDDIEADLARLREKGLALINERAYRNAHQDLVAFIHPKSTYGVLIELIECHDRAREPKTGPHS